MQFCPRPRRESFSFYRRTFAPISPKPLLCQRTANDWIQFNAVLQLFLLPCLGVCKCSSCLGIQLIHRINWILDMLAVGPMRSKYPVPKHDILTIVHVRDTMVQIVTFRLVEINAKEKGNLDIKSLVVEARSGICSKHDQICAN